MASPEAHERAKAILLTLGGTWSVSEAMAHLGVGRTRFAELRLQLLEAVLDAMEGGVRGRPRRREDPHAELIAKFEDEIAELTRLLERARTEIELLSGPAQGGAVSERYQRHAASRAAAGAPDGEAWSTRIMSSSHRPAL